MVGNVLDAYTTWLDLFRLPQCCVGKELNPLAAKNITKHFSRQMVWKGLGTAFVIFLLLTENSN